MAKNDWRANDGGTASRMNQPFWLASGVYNAGAAQLEIAMSPGSIRWPGVSDVVYSGQPQTVIIGSPEANRFYTVFMRSDRSFIVSGTTARSPVPGPPRWDAEPLGTIATGASVSTANLVLPGTQGVWGGYEQRGQMTATVRPHMAYRTFTQTIAYDNYLINLSGVAYLSMATIESGASYAQATVTWSPSGIGNNGIMRMYPAFYIYATSGTRAATIGATQDTRYEAGGSWVPGAQQSYTTTFVAIRPPGTPADGFRLSILPQGQGGMYITGCTFAAVDGFFGSNTNEL